LKLTTTNVCPVCSSQMDFNWETKEIPHFGEAMIIAGVCCCGYRHSDTILLSQKEPMRHTLMTCQAKGEGRYDQECWQCT
jgi:zinc finger protein